MVPDPAHRILGFWLIVIYVLLGYGLIEPIGERLDAKCYSVEADRMVVALTWPYTLAMVEAATDNCSWPEGTGLTEEAQ